MATDWRGVEYDVGSTIVYPAGIGSHGNEMVEGVVLSISPRHGTFSVRVAPARRSRSRTYPESPKAVTLTVTKNITVIG